MKLNTETGLKWCPGCRQHKPPGEFWRNKRQADGLMAACKSCCNARIRNWHATGSVSEPPEQNPIALAVRDLARQEHMWQGPTRDLLVLVGERLPGVSVGTLGAVLPRLTGVLREWGVSAEWHAPKVGGPRVWTISDERSRQ